MNNRRFKPECAACSRNGAKPGSLPPTAAFTIIEGVITMALVGILFISAFAAIVFNAQASNRLADHMAVFAMVQSKLEAVRAATYKPPNTYFRTTTVWLTNAHAIALDKNGSNYIVTGTIITRIDPAISGHLVTVTGRFNTPRRQTVVEMQTVVNEFSGGQQ